MKMPLKKFYQKRFDLRTQLVPYIFCAAILWLSSCSGGAESGTPIPTTPNSESDTSKYGAPSVSDPLAVESTLSTPCNVLTDKQLNEFPGEIRNEETEDTTRIGNGLACAWTFEGDRYSYGSLTAGFVLPTASYHGLSSIYRSHQETGYETFQPVEISGYPAIINNETDTTDAGDCRISVGLRDDTAYRVSATLSSEHPHYDQPCEQAKKLGEFVVENLKEAQ